MISSDFAPNESFSDALVALSMLMRPWRWRKGKAIGRLKQKLKRVFGPYEVFLYLTGRAALYRVLQALNLPEGSEVAVQGFTCEAVVLPLIELRLKPLYVDIETDSFSMDIEDLTRKITPQTKVLVLQHTFGMTPQHREKILAFAQETGVLVVEDLAHGFHSFNTNSADVKPQSRLNRDQRSILLLSFGRSKSLSSVFGGAILSTDETVNAKLKEIEKASSFPSGTFVWKALWYKPMAFFIKKTYDIYLGKVVHAILNILQVVPREVSSMEKRGEFDPIFIKAYPNALAHLLLNQFKQFDQINANRLNAVSQYKLHFFKNKEDFKVESLIRFPLLSDNRDRVIATAKKKNLFLGSWYDQVISPKELPLEKLKYEVGSCPVAEEICSKILNLPTTISPKEVEKVLDTVVSEAS